MKKIYERSFGEKAQQTKNQTKKNRQQSIKSSDKILPQSKYERILPSASHIYEKRNRILE